MFSRGTHTPPGLRWSTLFLVALSLSIGWGVRGNWGHEYGAMIPGALSAMAVCLLSGRDDWRCRVAFFAFFGALGWSFGGSMSYGVVIGYTHSDQFSSVLYGFVCLFAIGFLWGAMGGAGTAFPAFLNRDRLTEFLAPLAAVFIAWGLEGVAFTFHWLDEDRLNWHDTDWLAALLAIFAVLLLALVRRRFCRASSLILQLALGWWLGFLVLTVFLGLRMTPPRSDNWAGCTGMTVMLFVYLLRNRMLPVLFVSLMTGFFAGFGFSTNNAIKIVGEVSGIAVNWHSVMEQSFGFVSGLGAAIAMGYLSTRLRRVSDEPGVRSWTEPFCVGFVLLLVTYLNIRKNVEARWVPDQIPETMYGISAFGWFNIAYFLVALVVLLSLVRHHRVSLPVVPSSWLGKGQALYLLFLWWIVIGNLSRYLPFDPGRLITEGVIHVNACICTLLALLRPSETESVAQLPSPDYRRLTAIVVGIGLVVVIVFALIQTGVVMSVLDGPTGDLHLRFGPNASHLTG